jgi:general secretion pathway protein E
LALQTINTPEKNIITIEDPVEYEIPGVNQIPVNVKAGVTFAKGLRSILRQDPDVIMVGEIRDTETADIAVRAALTGHLVFSTLHTNDAATSIVRLIDMGIPLYLVVSSVCGVLAQRLVRTICPECKEPYQPSEGELSRLGSSVNTSELSFFKGKGCDKCAQTGYFGRTGIFELMVLDKELRAVVQAGKSSDEIREAALKQGMKLLWQDGLEKVNKGITTLQELNKATFIEGG